LKVFLPKSDLKIDAIGSIHIIISIKVTFTVIQPIAGLFPGDPEGTPETRLMGIAFKSLGD